MAKRKEEKIDYCPQVTSRIILKEIQKELKKNKNSNTNILLSPLSFHAVLNMTAVGARGDTLDQMLRFLGVGDINDLNSKFLNMTTVIESNSNGGPDLSFLNGMWVAHTHEIRDSFKHLATTLYKIEPKIVDFKLKEEVAEDVNIWAETASRGLIKDILKPKYITDDTKVLLANALYFKGTWDFDEERTMDRDFYLLNGDNISVPFMTGCDNFTYGSFEGYQVAKIPYEIGKNGDNKDFSMFIFLPNEKNGLPSLLEKVNSDPKFFTQKFNLCSVSLDAFYIPKFKFTYTAMKQVIRTMREMGLTLPFDDKCMELTEIVKPEGPFFVNRIIQKAFIEVNEKGTEAVVVTVVSDDDMGCSMYEAPRPRFVADHPFLFMVREEVSRLVLFTGAVLNPSNCNSDANSSSDSDDL
ncbi:serpin-Z2B-like isoform X1 [Solanum tuberosum]|uniref:serpin-Z2B-like isoform X1 n=1 Tax=Solanum tuberosum TaxID=4113 RepID=UPI00073A46C0|nr:PREDICTED: serpin-Z2B-like isoform X1 [Solanum tuberosum]